MTQFQDEIEREKFRRDTWREGELAGRENQKLEDQRKWEESHSHSEVEYVKLAAEYRNALAAIERLNKIVDSIGDEHRPVDQIRDPMNAVNLSQPILEALCDRISALADDNGELHFHEDISLRIGATGSDATEPFTYNKLARACEACRFAQQPPPGNVDTDEIRDILETGRFGMDDDDDYDKVRRLCAEVDRLRASRAPSAEKT